MLGAKRKIKMKEIPFPDVFSTEIRTMTLKERKISI